MHPSQIATTAISLLVPYLVEGGKAASQKAGEASWEKVSLLYQTIHDKLNISCDSTLRQPLHNLVDSPSDLTCQDIVKDMLVEKLLTDQDFSRQISKLLNEISQEQAVGKFVTKLYGNAKVDKIINIDQAGQVHID
jgi:uncharacterized membrane-anchored protein YjiN (DUF445 family)